MQYPDRLNRFEADLMKRESLHSSATSARKNPQKLNLQPLTPQPCLVASRFRETGAVFFIIKKSENKAMIYKLV
jgi:hypothetical protein